MSAPSSLPAVAAPRKDSGVRPVNDPIHVGAAYVYGDLCSAKRLAFAWGVEPGTARKYRLGMIVGALTRIAWEIAMLERSGIPTTKMLRFLLRVARHARRQRRARELARAPRHLRRAA